MNLPLAEGYLYMRQLLTYPVILAGIENLAHNELPLGKGRPVVGVANPNPNQHQWVRQNRGIFESVALEGLYLG